jgi:hypothetical protein
MKTISEDDDNDDDLIGDSFTTALSSAALQSLSAKKTKRERHKR